jgi:hypothetical protein
MLKKSLASIMCGVLFALSLGVTSAEAAAILTSQIRRASGQIFITDANGNVLFNLPQSESAPDTGPFSGSVFGGAAVFGYDGSYVARHTSTYVPPSPGIGGSFTEFLFTEGEATIGATQTDAAVTSETNAFSQAFIFFTLDQPMSWSWSAVVAGEFSGVGTNEYGFALVDVDDPLAPSLFEQAFNGTFAQTVSAGGLLPAGDWELAVTIFARADFPLTTGAGTGSVLLTDGRFALSPASVPEPSTIMLLLAALGVVLLKRGKRCRRIT